MDSNDTSSAAASVNEVSLPAAEKQTLTKECEAKGDIRLEENASKMSDLKIENLTAEATTDKLQALNLAPQPSSESTIAETTSKPTTTNNVELREANKLTPMEMDAVAKLKTLADNEGQKYESIFELAMFVLVAKCDVPKAYNRLKHLRAAETKYDLDSVDAIEAVSTLNTKSEAFMCSSGCTTENKTVVSIDYSKFLPSVWQDEDDIRKLLKALIVTRNATQNTIEKVRNGAVLVVQTRNMGRKNFSLSMEKTISSVLQDAYPMRTASILVLDPHFIVRTLMKLVTPFLKKKLVQRIVLCKLSEIPGPNDPGATETTSNNYKHGFHKGVLHQKLGGEFTAPYTEFIESEQETRLLSERIVEESFKSWNDSKN